MQAITRQREWKSTAFNPNPTSSANTHPTSDTYQESTSRLLSSQRL